MSTAADMDRIVLDFMNDDPLTAYIIQPGASTFDPATGTNTTNPIEIPVKAILLDLTLRRNGLSTMPNSLIQEGDKQLFVAPPEKSDHYRLPLVIDPAADKVRIGTKIYDVVVMKEVNPSAANVILYELYIRK